MAYIIDFPFANYITLKVTKRGCFKESEIKCRLTSNFQHHIFRCFCDKKKKEESFFVCSFIGSAEKIFRYIDSWLI